MRTRHQLLVDLLTFAEEREDRAEAFPMSPEEADIVCSDGFMAEAAHLLDLREEGFVE